VLDKVDVFFDEKISADRRSPPWRTMEISGVVGGLWFGRDRKLKDQVWPAAG